MTLRGLDVSACQGVIDWAKVPDEFRFVVIKASEGVSGLDPTRLRNLAGAKASGRAASFYHFLRPSQASRPQIETLWKAIGDQMPDFRPALDLEAAPATMTPAELAAWFLTCADAAEEYFGVPPLVYLYPWFYRSRVATAPGMTGALGARFARCPLWMADYSKGEAPAAGLAPFTPLPWTSWTFWQTSGNGSSRVLGIAGAVDHDLFNGDEAAFRSFRGLPTDDQLEPDAPILHPPVYGWTDDDDNDTKT